MAKRMKKKAKLLPHEQELLSSGTLVDVTHPRASAIWLHSDSKEMVPDDRVLCYRHMGDAEFAHLLQSNQLPATQPYQTLARNQEGRQYCESYFRAGNKYVDTHPTTVVEFDCTRSLVDAFYAKQSKVENGTISHGLGDKAGSTLPLFNRALADGSIPWRVVLVKRKPKT